MKTNVIRIALVAAVAAGALGFGSPAQAAPPAPRTVVQFQKLDELAIAPPVQLPSARGMMIDGTIQFPSTSRPGTMSPQWHLTNPPVDCSTCESAVVGVDTRWFSGSSSYTSTIKVSSSTPGWEVKVLDAAGEQVTISRKWAEGEKSAKVSFTATWRYRSNGRWVTETQAYEATATKPEDCPPPAPIREPEDALRFSAGYPSIDNAGNKTIQLTYFRSGLADIRVNFTTTVPAGVVFLPECQAGAGCQMPNYFPGNSGAWEAMYLYGTPVSWGFGQTLTFTTKFSYVKQGKTCEYNKETFVVMPPLEVVYTPAIALKKYVNGNDADVAPGVVVTVGQVVTWTYVLTNTGDVTLTSPIVRDDREGLIGWASDYKLAPGASLVFTKTGVAREGQYTNVGSVEIYQDGKLEVKLTASDPANYFGVKAEEPKLPILIAGEGKWSCDRPDVIEGVRFWVQQGASQLDSDLMYPDEVVLDAQGVATETVQFLDLGGNTHFWRFTATKPAGVKCGGKVFLPVMFGPAPVQPPLPAFCSLRTVQLQAYGTDYRLITETLSFVAGGTSNMYRIPVNTRVDRSVVLTMTDGLQVGHVAYARTGGHKADFYGDLSLGPVWQVTPDMQSANGEHVVTLSYVDRGTMCTRAVSWKVDP